VGIVARPHVVVYHVKDLGPENADAILLKRGVDLPFYILTRQRGEFGGVSRLRFGFPERHIHLAYKRVQPAKIVFSEHNLKPREMLQYRSKN
jgi:hypothetical protein